jgi:hypothetical protein
MGQARYHTRQGPHSAWFHVPWPLSPCASSAAWRAAGRRAHYCWCAWSKHYCRWLHPGASQCLRAASPDARAIKAAKMASLSAILRFRGGDAARVGAPTWVRVGGRRARRRRACSRVRQPEARQWSAVLLIECAKKEPSGPCNVTGAPLGPPTCAALDGELPGRRNMPLLHAC